MSNFVEVIESRYTDRLLLNIDSISYVHPDSGTVMINAVHGEGNGIMRFDKENIQKIVDAIEISQRQYKACAAHGVVGCREH